MGRAKEAGAEALTAVVDGAAAAARAVSQHADTAPAPFGAADEPTMAKPRTLSRGRAHHRLPDSARFALAVVLSFAISSLGRSFVDHCSDNEIGSITREGNSRTELFLLAARRLSGLALGWFADYDSYDLAALALLAHGPAIYLISVFYGIRAMTAGAYLSVDVVSAFLPFLLLRRLSGAHTAAPGIANRDIVADRGIQVLTSVHAALVYSVVLFLAGRYLLPSTLVLHFQGIPTILPAAEAPFLGLGSPTTLILSLLLGLAARTFIFTPLVATPRTSEDQKLAEFDPVNATLKETVAWNLWGYTTRTKVSLIRTAMAMLFTAVGTYLDTTLVIKGVEPYGAAVYASVWVTGALVTGVTLRYVGSI
ncbi:hypothetical protein N657DRAFT_431102 [Parathielavia appendiculata]|uniref:Uncharacterized protein n=1 Tax=Parathielavia appendiculata TaxID=2587402 RepID=A0AAN6TZY2_9PEZI|nr:hypothetical protein N657DRAFT_431102 [Parathielavia appendiculata]